MSFAHAITLSYFARRSTTVIDSVIYLLVDDLITVVHNRAGHCPAGFCDSIATKIAAKRPPKSKICQYIIIAYISLRFKISLDNSGTQAEISSKAYIYNNFQFQSVLIFQVLHERYRWIKWQRNLKDCRVLYTSCPSDKSDDCFSPNISCKGCLLFFGVSVLCHRNIRLKVKPRNNYKLDKQLPIIFEFLVQSHQLEN